MVINELKLIQGLINNNNELSASIHDAATQLLIKSSQTMLLELHRRADFASTDLYYQEGRSILALIPNRTPELNQLLQEMPDLLPACLNAYSRDQYVEKIRHEIYNLFKNLKYPFIENEQLKAALTKIAAWEIDGYKQKTPELFELKADEKPIAVDAAFLQNYLRINRPGYEDAKVSGCYPIPGGFSKQTVLFDVETNSGTERLVYRGTTKIQIIDKVLVDIANEFQTVSYAFSKGAPVAEPLWVQSDATLTGTRFFISRRALGTNLGTATQAHQKITPEATRSLAKSLAKIHSLPLDPANEILKKSHINPPSPDMSLPDVIRNRINDWAEYYRSLNCGTYPVMELAIQWLLDNIAPAEDEPVLVHGDYGLHNILIHENKVTAALDWENCHVGDRALDLSHLFAGTVGNMDHELFMNSYIEAGGKPVTQFRLKYFQVVMTMGFMLTTIDAQNIFQNRAGAGTNYCILGLGFIHHTASTIMNGIMEASACRAV